MIGKFIATEFGKAKRIDFWVPADPEKQPGVVVLVFSEQQVLQSNAQACYHYLVSAGDVKTTMLEIQEEKSTLTISIIDKERLLSVRVPGIPFSTTQYEEFVKKCEGKCSFAFLLGVDKGNGQRPVIVSTNDPFEILTLGGYKIIKR